MAMIMLQTKSSAEIMVLQQLGKYDEKQQPTAITRLHCCFPQDVTKFTWHHDFQFQYNKSSKKSSLNNFNKL
jgi:hypothetical protein